MSTSPVKLFSPVRISSPVPRFSKKLALTMLPLMVRGFDPSLRISGVAPVKMRSAPIETAPAPELTVSGVSEARVRVEPSARSSSPLVSSTVRELIDMSTPRRVPDVEPAVVAEKVTSVVAPGITPVSVPPRSVAQLLVVKPSETDQMLEPPTKPPFQKAAVMVLAVWGVTWICVSEAVMLAVVRVQSVLPNTLPIS